jgi:hypothetical protein
MTQQFFDPAVLPPAAGLFASPQTLVPTEAMVRPVLPASAGGGRRRTRRAHRGGFYPSVMGPFVENASAAIVPMALYSVYHTLVPKNPSKTLGGMWKRYMGAPSKTRRSHRRLAI